MSLWSKIKGVFSGGGAGDKKGPEKPDIYWMEADHSENPFGMRILNLMSVAFGLIGMSSDPEIAAKAVSWEENLDCRFDSQCFDALPAIPCDLRYPCAKDLPNGLLYAPPTMDQRWVIGYRDGALYMARSWTGELVGLAQTRREQGVLVLTGIKTKTDSFLHFYGDLMSTVDWLIRSHALGQKLPLKASPEAISRIEKTPTLAFSHFGQVLFALGEEWKPLDPVTQLRSDGELLKAVRKADLEQIKSLVESGVPIGAPLTHQGYTVLHIAMILGDIEIVQCLLALGADPNAKTDMNYAPLGVGIVHKAALEILVLLQKSGAEMDSVNSDGFGYLHAAAETNNVEFIPWLLERGLKLETRTKLGYTALHIACGLGHVEAARALLEAGADMVAASAGGPPRAIAVKENKDQIVRLLDESI
jgi:hypothetical protein